MELITSWQIYWFTRLDLIRSISIILMFIGFMATFISGLISLITQSDRDKSDHIAASNIFKWTAPIFVFGTLISCFVPNSKEAAAIWAIPKVVNNPQMQSIGTNTLNIAEIGIQYLQEKIKSELENEKQK